MTDLARRGHCKRNPPTRAEHVLGVQLREFLAATGTGSETSYRDMLSALEYYTTELLQYCEGWPSHESLDGVLPSRITKVDENEMEVLGVCILISDQTVTPMHATFRLTPRSEDIAMATCRVGEPDRASGGLLRLPYGSADASLARSTLPDRLGMFPWLFTIEVGSEITAVSRKPIVCDTCESLACSGCSTNRE